MKLSKLIILIASSLVVTACTFDNSDLSKSIALVHVMPAGEVDPLPKAYEYNKVDYIYDENRNPFFPSIAAMNPVEVKPAFEDNGIRPDAGRAKEALESFKLDTLQFVGIVSLNKNEWYLIRDSLGLVHKVRQGNFIGQNNGVILKADRTAMVVQEIVPREDGGYVYINSELAYLLPP